MVVRVAEHQRLTYERTPLFLRTPQSLKMGGLVSKKEEEPDPARFTRLLTYPPAITLPHFTHEETGPQRVK